METCECLPQPKCFRATGRLIESPLILQLFWFGACPPVLIIIFRLCLPETQAYREREKVREAGHNVSKTFIAEGKVALKKHWLLLIYMVLLMAGFNFMVSTSLPTHSLQGTIGDRETNLLQNSRTVRKTSTRPCSRTSTTSAPTPSP